MAEFTPYDSRTATADLGLREEPLAIQEDLAAIASGVPWTATLNTHPADASCEFLATIGARLSARHAGRGRSGPGTISTSIIAAERGELAHG